MAIAVRSNARRFFVDLFRAKEACHLWRKD
jgi:hypothetical protein